MGTQPTISTYFSQTPRKRTTSPIDLTLSDDESEQPARKRLRSETGVLSVTPATPKASTQAEQWRFSPSPHKQDLEGEPPKRSKEALKRHEAFKKKLLLENSLLLRRPNADDDTISACKPFVPSDSDSEPEFKTLNRVKSRKSGKKPKPLGEVGPSGQTYTPLEKQVLELQRQNPDTVLMIEVGYKYKFFDEDAKIAAKELGMVCFNDRNFLVASIPTHRRDVHLQKLLSQGYRVGICAQVETAALKKVGDNRNTPFRREVTALYTAATYVDGLDSVEDDESLSPPPAIMCIVEEAKNAKDDVLIGLVSICPKTGDVVWDCFKDSKMRLELETRLIHLRPSELIIPKDLTSRTMKLLSHFTNNQQKKFRTEAVDIANSQGDSFDFITAFLTSRAKGRSNAVLAELTDLPRLCYPALEQLVRYLDKFSIANIFVETKFFRHFLKKTHMLLGADTIQGLEIISNNLDFSVKGSLLSVLDRTKTRFGSRLLKNWISKPLVDPILLRERLDAVDEIVQTSSEMIITLRQVLDRCPDLAKGLSRMAYGQAPAEELAVVLASFQKIGNAIKPARTAPFQSSILSDVITTLPKVKVAIDSILSVFSLAEAKKGNMSGLWLDPDKYPAIDDTLRCIRTIEAELKEELKTYRKLLKLPGLQYTTVADTEYLIEVRNADKREIPPTWIFDSKTKIVSRYHSPEVREKIAQLNQNQEMLEAVATSSYKDFLQEITNEHYSVMREVVNKLAEADCLISFAQVALSQNYTKPLFCDEDVLEVDEGRHPIQEALRSDPVVPNGVKMGEGSAPHKVLTGPNMAGKSSFVKMVACLCIMAQSGSFVPAAVLRLRPLDGILTRMGASDDIMRGQSSFMKEMEETSNILANATSNSLAILDELGRGTSTYDGVAIAEATMQHLVNVTKCKTMFITHFTSFGRLEIKFPKDIQNLYMAFEEQVRLNGSREITFLYKAVPGIARDSFGIECARLAGLPGPLLSVASHRAEELQNIVDKRTRRKRIAQVVGLLQQAVSSSSITRMQSIQSLLREYEIS